MVSLIDRFGAATGAIADLGLEHAQKALAEINLLLRLLQEAKYEVSGVEAQLGVPPTITLKLSTSPAVSYDKLNVFLQENKDKSVLTTILTALIQANRLRDAVNVETLALKHTTIMLATPPAVTLHWAATSST